MRPWADWTWNLHVGYPLQISVSSEEENCPRPDLRNYGQIANKDSKSRDVVGYVVTTWFFENDRQVFDGCGCGVDIMRRRWRESRCTTKRFQLAKQCHFAPSLGYFETSVLRFFVLRTVSRDRVRTHRVNFTSILKSALIAWAVLSKCFNRS